MNKIAVGLITVLLLFTPTAVAFPSLSLMAMPSKQRIIHQITTRPFIVKYERQSFLNLNSSTDEIQEASTESFLDDVDGIGELTTSPPSTLMTSFITAPLSDDEISDNEDLGGIHTISGYIDPDTASLDEEKLITSTEKLLDPTILVENIIGTSSNELCLSVKKSKYLDEANIESLVEPLTGYIEPTSSTLDDEILRADKLDDTSSQVKDIIGSENPELGLIRQIPNLFDDTCAEYQAPAGNDDSLLADTRQLLDPNVIVEEIIGSAISDPRQTLNNDVTIVEEETIEAPSLQKIIKFALPAIGVWLCSPLLSLIDTSTVGLLSGTAQQAALNPAVAVTDYTGLIVAFMYTATTNLVAGASELEKNSEEKILTSKTLINALQLSGFVGITLGLTLSGLAPILLRTIIGNKSIDPVVFDAALRYVRLRAIGMPAAVIIGSAQSACLGMQDMKSPLYVLVAAALVNLLGDIIFVPSSNPWLGGAAGAAIATVFSQYAALGIFMKWLNSKPRPTTINVTDAILELTGKSKEGKLRRRNFYTALQKSSLKMHGDHKEKTTLSKTRSLSFHFSKIFKRKDTKNKDVISTKGFLAGKMKKRSVFQLPPLEEARKFWPYVIPVTTTSFGRISAYVAMSHVVSSSLGTLSMAANQVVLSVFYCLCPGADSLSLTAQSLVPRIFQKKWGPARAKALRKTKENFMKAGVITGLVTSSIVSLTPLFSTYFSSDPRVLAQIHSVVPLLACIFALHPSICVGEGLLLGQRDLGFLGRAYASFFFLVPYFMLRLKKMALFKVGSVSLNSLWEVFFGYQLVRLAVWALRLRHLNEKASKPIPDEMA